MTLQQQMPASDPISCRIADSTHYTGDKRYGNLSSSNHLLSFSISSARRRQTILGSFGRVKTSQNPPREKPHFELLELVDWRQRTYHDYFVSEAGFFHFLGGKASYAVVLPMSPEKPDGLNPKPFSLEKTRSISRTKARTSSV